MGAAFYTDSQYHKAFIPDDVQNTITFVPEKSRAAWEKTVGFRAKDVVGKIAPEIKLGKYTLSDKEKHPFKELMIPHHYDRWNAPGGEGLPNHIGYFTDFELIETQQGWQIIYNWMKRPSEPENSLRAIYMPPSTRARLTSL